MKLQPKIFTLEEANALIPELDSRVSRLVRKKAEYITGHDTLFMHELISSAEGNAGYSQQNEAALLDADFRQLESNLSDIQSEIEQINEMGCVLRDLDSGTVDFLGRRGEDLIYYCWHRGDSCIRYYRETQAKGELLPL